LLWKSIVILLFLILGIIEHVSVWLVVNLIFEINIWENLVEDWKSNNCVEHEDNTHNNGADGSRCVSEAHNREGSPDFAELYISVIQIRE
jgi:hypothetical protein